MEELFLPVLSHFHNQNVWTASRGRMRYRVTPGEDGLLAEVWEDPWCYELSRVEYTQAFPLEEEGIEVLRAWLLERAVEFNARPAKSLAESLACRGKPEGAGNG